MANSKQLSIILALVILSPALFAKKTSSENSGASELKSFRGKTMGTTYLVKYFENPATKTTAANTDAVDIQEGVETILARVNAEMSTYIKESEISRFNRLAPGIKMRVSDGFAKVTLAAISLAEKSDGYFDPTVGPLLKLYAHGYDRQNSLQKTLPSEKQITEALKAVGFQKIKPSRNDLSGNYLSKTTVSTELDLSAIAKGYGVDLIYEYIESLGIKTVLVDIGGELRGSLANEQKFWKVGIESPAAKTGQKPLAILGISQMAVATSGNYRNFRMLGGKRVGHVVNPKSGAYTPTAVASVSVLDKSCMIADGWATALLAMPAEKLEATIAKNSLKALWATYETRPGIFWSSSRKLVVRRSKALQEYEHQKKVGLK